MKIIVRGLLCLGLLVSSLGLFSRPWWLELLGHARLFYLVVLLVLAPLLRERLAAGLWLLTVLLNLGCVAPLYFGGARGTGNGKLVLCNVLSSNPTPTRVRDFLLQEQADLVVLLEIQPDWLPLLAPVLDQYAGQVLLPHRRGNFGMAVLSRRPLTNTRVLDGETMPIILADTEVAGKKLHVVGAHPIPPVGAEQAARRNGQIGQVGKYLQSCPRPFALLGDLNNTPWSPSLAPIRDVSVTARAGFGLHSSWPTNLPAWLRIPIDQCYVSEGVRVVDFRLGPDVGSDHFPIVVGVSL